MQVFSDIDVAIHDSLECDNIYATYETWLEKSFWATVTVAYVGQLLLVVTNDLRLVVVVRNSRIP